jgi:hypothetical protein
MGYHYQRDLYTSIAASGITSETALVGDFQDAFTLQVIGSPSTTTHRCAHQLEHAYHGNWSRVDFC